MLTGQMRNCLRFVAMMLTRYPGVCEFKLFKFGTFLDYIRVFHSLYKVGRNRNFVFKGFNNSKKKQLLPVGLNLVKEIITGSGVQYLTI